MAENVYEGMFILDSNRYARDAGAAAAQIAEMIEKHGGKMLVSRLWEERRLAYAIGSHRKGTYWLSYFKLDSTHLTSVNRDCHLNETIIRSLILKIDPRIVDTLVSHALAGPAEMAKAKRPEPAALPKVLEAIEVPEELGN